MGTTIPIRTTTAKTATTGTAATETTTTETAITETAAPEPTPEPTPAPVQPPVRTPTPVPVASASPSPNDDEEDLEHIGHDDTPLAGFTPAPTIEPTIRPDESEESWALVNLIALIGTVAAALAMTVSFLRIRDDEESESRRRGKSKLFGLIPALVSIVAFVLTEDMGSRMALVDKWTIPMIVLLLANGILAWITRSEESGDAA